MTESNQPTTNIKDCIKEKIRIYFKDLDGEKSTGVYKMVIQDVERQLVQCVLEETGGNQSWAASILGVSRSTLKKKIERYGLRQKCIQS